MNKPIRTMSILVGLLFLALLVNQTWLQSFGADRWNSDARNRRVVDAEYSRQRGACWSGAPRSPSRCRATTSTSSSAPTRPR